MEENDQSIGPLKKLTLLVEAKGDGKERGEPGEPVTFEFIFGIGSEGLSPFEMDLAEKSVGDVLVLELEREQAEAYFQHLFPPPNITKAGEALSLRVRVVHVAYADQREVIRAMAEAQSCADHCCGH